MPRVAKISKETAKAIEEECSSSTIVRARRQEHGHAAARRRIRRAGAGAEGRGRRGARPPAMARRRRHPRRTWSAASPWSPVLEVQKTILGIARMAKDGTTRLAGSAETMIMSKPLRRCRGGEAGRFRSPGAAMSGMRGGFSAGGPVHFSRAGTSYFRPANPGMNPTEGWDPFDPLSEGRLRTGFSGGARPDRDRARGRLRRRKPPLPE